MLRVRGCGHGCRVASCGAWFCLERAGERGCERARNAFELSSQNETSLNLSSHNPHSGRSSGTRGDGDDGFRAVNDFTTRLNEGRQGKHIIGRNNYISGRSAVRISMVRVQKLVETYAGQGNWCDPSKETVEFGESIGTWVSPDGKIRPTTSRGAIHYSKQGCHVIPARPTDRSV